MDALLGLDLNLLVKSIELTAQRCASPAGAIELDRAKRATPAGRQSGADAGCVPGMARLLNGDV